MFRFYLIELALIAASMLCRRAVGKYIFHNKYISCRVEKTDNARDVFVLLNSILLHILIYFGCT